MSDESVDVFFDSLIHDAIMKRIVRLIAESKDDDEIVEDLLTRRSGGQ